MTWLVMICIDIGNIICATVVCTAQSCCTKLELLRLLEIVLHYTMIHTEMWQFFYNLN